MAYLPMIPETQFQSLGQEDPLEKGTATHSSILAWRISWTEEPGGPESMGLKESDTTERLTLFLTKNPDLALFWYLNSYITMIDISVFSIDHGLCTKQVFPTNTGIRLN